VDASVTTASKSAICHATAPNLKSSVAATAMRKAIRLVSVRSRRTGLVSSAATVRSMVMVQDAALTQLSRRAVVSGATVEATLVLPVDGLIVEEDRVMLRLAMLTSLPPPTGLMRPPLQPMETPGAMLVQVRAGSPHQFAVCEDDYLLNSSSLPPEHRRLLADGMALVRGVLNDASVLIMVSAQTSTTVSDC
jgi:hypothetical protein